MAVETVTPELFGPAEPAPTVAVETTGDPEMAATVTVV